MSYPNQPRAVQAEFETTRMADLLAQVIVHTEIQEAERAGSRLEGRASAAAFPGADLVVRVAVSELFVNCSRYVHTYRRETGSRYAPRAATRA